MEEILGGLESLNIAKGVLRGYALYVTNERIIGAKMKGKELLKFLGGWKGDLKKSLTPFEWRGTTIKVPKLTGEDASRLLEDLKGRTGFEIKKHEIQEIELKKPGMLGGGHVKIKTGAGKEHKIRIIAGGKEEYEHLKETLQQFCPEKLKT